MRRRGGPAGPPQPIAFAGSIVAKHSGGRAIAGDDRRRTRIAGAA